LKKNWRRDAKLMQKNKSILPSVPDAFGLLAEEGEGEEGEANNIDRNEMKEIYQFKLKIFENEERRFREELHMLDKEKVQYIQEFKRIRDEEASKYCGIQSKGQFTVL